MPATVEVIECDCGREFWDRPRLGRRAPVLWDQHAFGLLGRWRTQPRHGHGLKKRAER